MNNSAHYESEVKEGEHEDPEIQREINKMQYCK